MKKSLNIAVAALLATSCLTSPVHASEVSELKAMMQQMNQQMQLMQERINELEAEQKQTAKEQHVQAEKMATMSPAAGKASSDSDVIVTLKPTPKFATRDGSFTAKIIGFGQADAVFHSDDSGVDHPNSTTIKRARVGIAGTFFHDWGYKFLYDFGNNNNDQLQDLFITYNGFNNTQLIVGQYKEPIGLEWQSPSKYWTFMELPLTTALTPRRSIGAGFNTTVDAVRLNLGVFGENANRTRTDDEGYSFDGHLVYTPIHEKRRHVHVGASGSYRVPDAGSDAVTYSAGHETSSASGNYVTTGSITSVDNIVLGGVEALGIFGPVLVQGEYVMSDVSRDGGLADVDFTSYYAQIAWMLTGESRKFNSKKHMFTRVVPNHPFTLNGSGWGAFEMAARIENLDLNDGAISGGELDRYVAGLNWHPNMYTRFMLNYTMVDSDANATIANDNSHAVGVRAQIDF